MDPNDFRSAEFVERPQTRNKIVKSIGWEVRCRNRNLAATPSNSNRELTSLWSADIYLKSIHGNRSP